MTRIRRILAALATLAGALVAATAAGRAAPQATTAARPGRRCLAGGGVDQLRAEGQRRPAPPGGIPQLGADQGRTKTVGHDRVPPLPLRPPRSARSCIRGSHPPTEAP